MPAKRSTKPTSAETPSPTAPIAAPVAPPAPQPQSQAPAPALMSQAASSVTANKRGRKVDETLPQSHQRNVQRQFRARRANHLLELERRVALLERENSILRHWCNLQPAPRYLLGRGPTGCDTSKPLIADEDDPEICLIPNDPNSTQPLPTDQAPSQIHQHQQPSRPPPAVAHASQQHTPAPSLSPVEIHAPRYDHHLPQPHLQPPTAPPTAPGSVLAPNTMVMHGEPVYHHDGRLAYPTAPQSASHSYLDSFASHRPMTASSDCPPVQDHSYGQPIRPRQSVSAFPQYGLLEGYTA